MKHILYILNIQPVLIYVSHLIYCVDDGKLYTFGDGSNGQLGHGNIQLQTSIPQQVLTLKNHKVKWSSCGENHTAVITGMVIYLCVMVFIIFVYCHVPDGAAASLNLPLAIQLGATVLLK